MLNSGRGYAERGGGLTDSAERFDHVGDSGHPIYVRYSHDAVKRNCANPKRAVAVRKPYSLPMDDRDRINGARKAQKVRREDLAKHLGVSLDSIGRLLRKDRALMASERDKAFDLLGLKNDDRPKGRPVPVVGEIAGGDWRAAIQESLGWEWAQKGGEQTFALIVRGNSMNKVAGDGAVVFVDPDARGLSTGSLYAIVNSTGDATFKRYRADPAQLEPMSNDPIYQPIVIGSDPFSVIGEIVEVRLEPSQLPN